MNIGEVAQLTGLSSKMIRYYETMGLLPNIERSAAGYRIYSAQDIKSLQFIAHARELDFSVAQIKELLALWRNQSRQSAEVKQLALQHIYQLEKRIAELQAMLAILKQTAACCDGGEMAECPILEQIELGVTPCSTG
ncbi:Cu(I)-responsive transcriptional regulator [Acinetobacter sp. MD2(2019)]|uniref:Cu(I)-responsive transcriptional regulator n=1 Tax=Acinetobacter sp. MD2(2019) TaxID=2605273 RepID=UPI002D1F8363|nr:Cu(I)-responsive transcriptional regulator [Acinetobacter sp. MD2(2019)]MEB3753930.1 Cu(I)-responsive transcriptional regulator [Acinetobacter sp. MD2(2019)]